MFLKLFFEDSGAASIIEKVGECFMPYKVGNHPKLVTIEEAVGKAVILGYRPVALTLMLGYCIVRREIESAVSHTISVIVTVKIRENTLSMKKRNTPTMSMDLTFSPCFSHNSINSLERSRMGRTVYSRKAPKGLTNDCMDILFLHDKQPFAPMLKSLAGVLPIHDFRTQGNLVFKLIALSNHRSGVGNLFIEGFVSFRDMEPAFFNGLGHILAGVIYHHLVFFDEVQVI